MSIDMNEELPDPTPRGADILVQQTLADMAWMLRAARSPMLLSSLVRADLKDDAALAEIALSTRHRWIVEQVKAREASGEMGMNCDLTVYNAQWAWRYGNTGASVEEVVLAQMAPLGVAYNG